MIVKKLLSLLIAVTLFLSIGISIQAEELLWTEQAGQLICKELSEGLKLESDSELLSIPGMDQFEKQIKANEDPELLVIGQMLRRCPLLTFQSIKQSIESNEEG